MGASEYPTFKKAVSRLSYSERLDTALKIALVNVRNTGMFGQNMHATNCLIIHCIEDAYNSLVAIAEAAPDRQKEEQ